MSNKASPQDDEDSATARQSWWRRKVIASIAGQLKQGTTPTAIAVTMAAGVTLGLFPILGATTLLCGVVAAAWKLNQPIIQLVNYLMYPAQILLLIPFYRAGETLFDQPHVPIISVGELMDRFWEGPGQFMIDYGMVALYGITVWAVASPLIFGLVYLLTLGPIKGLKLLGDRARSAGPGLNSS